MPQSLTPAIDPAIRLTSELTLWAAGGQYRAGQSLSATIAASVVSAPLIINGQIVFPATQNPSADPNTLDDYEEGAFTPTIIGTGAAGVGTYTNQIGRYTKIGRQVFFEILLSWTAHTGTGNMQIAGLPFTSAATQNTPVSCAYNAITYTGTQVGVRVVASTTTLQPLQWSSALAFTAIAIDAAGQIDVAGCYVV